MLESVHLRNVVHEDGACECSGTVRHRCANKIDRHNRPLDGPQALVQCHEGEQQSGKPLVEEHGGHAAKDERCALRNQNADCDAYGHTRKEETALHWVQIHLHGMTTPVTCHG
jgi:hypothetical protein